MIFKGEDKMLSATPNKQFELELFRLALSLCVTEKETVPTSLRKHFNKVLSQAKRISDKPNKISKTILPEAVELALEMRSHEDILSDISKINDFDQLTPDTASHLLNSMECSSVCKI